MKKFKSIFLLVAILLVSCAALVGCKSEPKEYNITISSCQHGSISANKTKALEGEEIVVTAVAETGYSLVSLKYNDTAIENGKFIMPKKDVVITAKFTKIQNSQEQEDPVEDDIELPVGNFISTLLYDESKILINIKASGVAEVATLTSDYTIPAIYDATYLVSKNQLTINFNDLTYVGKVTSVNNDTIVLESLTCGQTIVGTNISFTKAAEIENGVYLTSDFISGENLNSSSFNAISITDDTVQFAAYIYEPAASINDYMYIDNLTYRVIGNFVLVNIEQLHVSYVLECGAGTLTLYVGSSTISYALCESSVNAIQNASYREGIIEQYIRIRDGEADFHLVGEEGDIDGTGTCKQFNSLLVVFSNNEILLFKVEEQGITLKAYFDIDKTFNCKEVAFYKY